MKFREFNISEEILGAIDDLGFEEATPIQAQTIPHIMEGRDVIGQAQTGTGKTCAFGIPAIEMLDPAEESVQVLILCPTRELAIQSSEELKSLTKYKSGIRILPIYGGQPIDRQIRALKNHPQIIIGTPGRVMDHMRRHTLKLANLKIMVLDEADEMLNMGFRDDIDTILGEIPEERQTVLFSATMPKEIMDLTNKYQKAPIHIKISHKELTVPGIEQYYLIVGNSAKPEILSRLIDANDIKLALVFCNTKKRVDDLAGELQSRGYSAEALHGDMRQEQRDKVMSRFRNGQFDILIATDVAARGIDVDDVEAVFNYDLPGDDEYYVHRIGRTGRAGKTGKAYSFVSGREVNQLKDIQRFTKSKILPIKPPTLMDVEENKINKLLSGIKNIIAEGKLSKYSDYVERTIDEMNSPDGGILRDGSEEGEDQSEESFISPLDFAAAMLKMIAEPAGGNASGKSEITPETSVEDNENYDTGAETGYVRLFINVGRKDRIQPGNIVQSIASTSGLPGKLIGAIDIYDSYTFVEVPREYAHKVLDSMKDYVIKGRKVNIERSNQRPAVRRRTGAKRK
ncbi:MAG TPA: DEAD/DEAH box helicase [Clostridia bacterium]|nr:DEAD/DEAH box helicase [Clostridia bacterium]